MHEGTDKLMECWIDGWIEYVPRGARTMLTGECEEIHGGYKYTIYVFS